MNEIFYQATAVWNVVNNGWGVKIGCKKFLVTCCSACSDFVASHSCAVGYGGAFIKVQIAETISKDWQRFLRGCEEL